ncbi:putative alpha-L-fucosidase [Helianthus anomalus]
MAAITYVDIYSVKYSLMAQSEELGFGDPFLVCFGYGGKYNFNNEVRCGKMKMANGTKMIIVKSCEDPSSRIVWDGIADGSYSDPPVPLKMACHGKLDIRRLCL